MARLFLKYPLILICFMQITRLCAQSELSESYELLTNIEYYSEIESDQHLFLVPIERSNDAFEQLSEFNFLSVRYRRRGYENSHTSYIINGLELRSPIINGIDYGIWSALTRSGYRRYFSSGLSVIDGEVGGAGGVYEMRFRPSEAVRYSGATIFGSTRNYRYGIKAESSGGNDERGRYYRVFAGRRWGPDATVMGVFSDETTISGSYEQRIAKDHSITILGVAAPAIQGLRTGSTREAFDLLDDNYYNPLWGYTEGRVRNSRIRESFRPLFVATYDGLLSKDTKIQVSAGYTFGKSSYSGLTYFAASNPHPDYYYNMPSYFSSPEIREYAQRLWQTGESDVVHIPWERLIQQNASLSWDSPAYITDKRVENVDNLQVVAKFTTRFAPQVSASYGMRTRRDHSEYYKEAYSLLGALSFRDIDPFISGQEQNAALVLNDLQNPEREVGSGDRFGYNYGYTHTQTDIFGLFSYEEANLSIRIGAELSSSTLFRRGLYEKGTFPGERSLGKSKTLKFSPYALKTSVSLYLSPRQAVTLSGLYSQLEPAPDDYFLSPEYCNILTNARQAALAGGELSYMFSAGNLRIKMTAYATRIDNLQKIWRYYDDISGIYVNMVENDISQQYLGVETGAIINLTPRLTWSLAAAAARNTYAADPAINIFADIDKELLLLEGRAGLKGFNLGGTPATVASSELNYWGTNGWSAIFAINFIGGNYITPAPIRRMPRALDSAVSPEAREIMAKQERLDDAVTMNLTLFKTMYYGSRRLMFVLSAYNLLDNRNIVSNAYESMRLRRSGSGLETGYRSFDNKYTYALPRTFFGMVSYRF